MTSNKKKLDKFELLVELPLRDMHGNIDAPAYKREITPANRTKIARKKKQLTAEPV